MAEEAIDKKGPGHKKCGILILDAKHKWPNSAPRDLREATHGCWCSFWRLTDDGLYIWRCGDWRKPDKGEVTRPKAKLP